MSRTKYPWSVSVMVGMMLLLGLAAGCQNAGPAIEEESAEEGYYDSSIYHNPDATNDPFLDQERLFRMQMQM